MREPLDRRIVAAACMVASLATAACGGTEIAAPRRSAEAQGGSGRGGGAVGMGGASGGTSTGGASTGGRSPIGTGGLGDGGSMSDGGKPPPLCDPTGEVPCIVGNAEPCSGS